MICGPARSWQTHSMPRVQVQVRADHVERLTRADAVAAIAELVWNSLDAEATTIEVQLERVPQPRGDDAIGTITVRDNGHGVAHDQVEALFTQIGGSWKKVAANRLSKNRKVVLHGERGQGRLKAFTLGDDVIWSSVSEDRQGGRGLTMVEIHRSSLDTIEIADQEQRSDEPLGTTVTIYNPTPKANALLDRGTVVGRLTEISRCSSDGTPRLDQLRR